MVHYRTNKLSRSGNRFQAFALSERTQTLDHLFTLIAFDTLQHSSVYVQSTLILQPSRKTLLGSKHQAIALIVILVSRTRQFETANSIFPQLYIRCCDYFVDLISNKNRQLFFQKRIFVAQHQLTVSTVLSLCAEVVEF